MTDAARRKWLGTALLGAGALQARHAWLFSDVTHRGFSDTRALAYLNLLWIPLTLVLGASLWSPWRSAPLTRRIGSIWLLLSFLALALAVLLGLPVVPKEGLVAGLSLAANTAVCLAFLHDVHALLFAPHRRLCPYRLTVITSLSLLIPAAVGLSLGTAEPPRAGWAPDGAHFSGMPVWQATVSLLALAALLAAARHARAARPLAWLLALTCAALPLAARQVGLPLDELLPTSLGLAFWLTYLGFNLRR